jgi:hypothetical protein
MILIDLNIGYVVESSSIGSSQTSDTTSSRPQKGLPNGDGNAWTVLGTNQIASRSS